MRGREGMTYPLQPSVSFPQDMTPSMQTVRGQQGPVVVAGGVGVVVTTTAGSVMVRDGVVWQAGAVTTGSTAMPLVH
jgi:hypothetical protein